MTDNLDKAMKDPGDVFERPGDVLRSSFKVAEQREILRSWDDLLTQRLAATTEGMTRESGEETAEEVLQAVRSARTRLEQDES